MEGFTESAANAVFSRSQASGSGGSRSFSNLRESGKLERSGKEYVLKPQGAKVPPPYGAGTRAPAPNEALTLAAIHGEEQAS